MFSKRKEEKEIMSLLISNLRENQTNNALIVAKLNQPVEKKGTEVVDSNIEPITAAYALNLCTVSVSQIIDYEDLVVLEQEYDAILNNLNLENIPKDEALLNILKQILDTITFFRIQAGDKKIIEKEYQQKMKDAIWSAVPSFGVILASGNPWAALATIATQVGVGYMNYRKTKASTNLEYEKQMWQLQRSAIEQLNGLRRELFDASWRLAKKYKFKEELRLTEKQISQYNEILMDPDNLRRYERLASIAEYFDAFPPFWYYLGHAANLVSDNAKRTGDTEVELKYRELAKQHFKQYRDHNVFGLLREDMISSSCALEWIDLLNVEQDQKLIAELLDSAVSTSGRACDILQLCALTYLRIGKTDDAVVWLRYLVNEGYNSTTNAQLLSYIYVSAFFATEDSNIQTEYRLLASRINGNLLFPFPEGNETKDELTAAFEKHQKLQLMRKYAVIIERIINRYTIKFNKAIPEPVEGRVYSENLWEDNPEMRKERLSQYKKVFNKEEDQGLFSERLENANVFYEWIDIFNDMLNKLERMFVRSSEDEYVTGMMTLLADEIEAKFRDNEKSFSDLQEKMSNKFEVEDFERLYKYSFDYFSRRVFSIYIKELQKAIYEMPTMSSITTADIQLKVFCEKNELPDPDILILGLGVNNVNEIDKIFLSADILGGAAFEKAEESKLVKEMAKCINDKVLSAIEGDRSKVYPVLKFGEGRHLFKSQFMRKKFLHTYRSILVGAIVDKNIGHNGIVFTSRGLFVEEAFTGLTASPELIDYSTVTCEDGYLYLGNKKYKNKDLNIGILYGIIQDLSAMAQDCAKYGSDENLLVEQSSVPMLEVLDYEEPFDEEFEMQVSTSIRKKDTNEVECYGVVIKGNKPLIGDSVEIQRGESICSVAEILDFKVNSVEDKDGTIWLKTSSEIDFMRGDLIKVSKN